MKFVVAADVRGIPGKTVHNQLLCVVQHLNASNDMRFSTFQNLYCLFTSTREVALHGCFYRGNYIAYSLLQER